MPPAMFEAPPPPPRPFPADPRVDLVEHRRPVSPLPRGGVAESKHDTRKPPSRRRRRKGAQLLPRVGAQQKLRLVEPVRREGFRPGRAGSEFDPELRAGKRNPGKLLLKRAPPPLRPLAPLPAQLRGRAHGFVLLLPQQLPPPSFLLQRPLEPLPLPPEFREH